MTHFYVHLARASPQKTLIDSYTLSTIGIDTWFIVSSALPSRYHAVYIFLLCTRTLSCQFTQIYTWRLNIMGEVGLESHFSLLPTSYIE